MFLLGAVQMNGLSVFSAQSNSRRPPGESAGTSALADSLIPVNDSAPALVITAPTLFVKIVLAA